MPNNLIQGQRPVIQIANRIITDLDNLIILYGYIDGAANIYSSFKKAFTSASFSAGSNGFKLLAVKLIVSNGAIDTVSVGYSDTGVGLATTTVPTNFVAQWADLGNAYALSPPAGQGSNQSSSEFILDGTIPSGKFPTIKAAGTGSKMPVQLYGYNL